MDINSALAQIRPLTQAAGVILIIVGLLKFFGVQIPISGNGLEIAVAGFLMKSI